MLKRFQTTTSLQDAKDCDLVIEVRALIFLFCSYFLRFVFMFCVNVINILLKAIAENMDLKLDFYKTIGKIVKPSAILASNTSSLAITSMGVASGRPEQFVGLHFFNPVQMMKLVEVIKTAQTSPVVFDTMLAFGNKIGKTTVKCSDTPGFIVNRLLVPYLTQVSV